MSTDSVAWHIKAKSGLTAVIEQCFNNMSTFPKTEHTQHFVPIGETISVPFSAI